MKSFLTACGLVDSLQLVIESEDVAEGELRLLQQPFALSDAIAVRTWFLIMCK